MTWLVLLGAALAGAFLRSLTSAEQQTWCWQTVVHTAMGGLVAVAVYVILGILPWTAATMAKLDAPLEQAFVVGPFSYIAAHILANRGADWLAALGDKLTERRPSA